MDEPSKAEELLREFIDLVSRSAPLTWVAHQNMDAAHEWEKEASTLLERFYKKED